MSISAAAAFASWGVFSYLLSWSLARVRVEDEGSRVFVILVILVRLVLFGF